MASHCMCVGGEGSGQGKGQSQIQHVLPSDVEKDWDDKALKESGGGKNQTLAERLSMEEGSIP